ncbi:MAG: helix-turn-helix transcriptional regulator [Phycisphaerae bacterium]|nr:helix-turn-helix transcriptional regulator [Phycisphaerae bacterium]
MRCLCDSTPCTSSGSPAYHHWEAFFAAALSRLAGLSDNYISILERDDARPKSATVGRIADALQLTSHERAELIGCTHTVTA